MLIKGLRAGEVTEIQGRQYCKDFLTMLPILTADDAADKISAYVAENPLFAELKICVDTTAREA